MTDRATGARGTGARGTDGETVRATYRIESRIGLERAAETLAGEQSSGTFTRVAGETEELQKRHRARVASLAHAGELAEPSLPGAAGEGPVQVGIVEIDFPLENFGPSIPNLLATVAGNLFELRELAGCRLLDVELPPAFADAYPGPRFGISGTRRLMSAPTGALLGGIVKPSVGLSPEEQAARVLALAEAGADFAKDDELIADPPYSPLAERVRHVMAAVDRAAERTGRKLMYAFNITGDIDELRRRHDLVVEAGGTCVMLCVNLVGLGGVRYVREFAEVPIHGHRALIGALMRHPALGIDFRAFQKLARLAGVDHLHTNGMRNKFYETDDEVQASIEAVRTPLFGGYEVLPVLSSQQWAGTAAEAYRRVRTTDLLMIAGGGIFAHPDGPGAGVRSLREAWEAAVAGVPLEERATTSAALRAAIAQFSRA
ncbi:MAG TPA: ribulose-bisphosphate carboxylase large subunit family protein [Acidimicrobiales bacterium]|nr:ribulose-bisphosphate carboxylase large subunit family protein [Acidimicrobiales bacterium]